MSPQIQQAVKEEMSCQDECISRIALATLTNSSKKKKNVEYYANNICLFSLIYDIIFKNFKSCNNFRIITTCIVAFTLYQRKNNHSYVENVSANNQFFLYYNIMIKGHYISEVHQLNKKEYTLLLKYKKILEETGHNP